MTEVSNKLTERARLRELHEEREPGALGQVPWEQGRLFAQLFTVGDEGAGAQSFASGEMASAGIAMIEALAEQLAPRVLAGAQWPLHAVLYLPRLGRINSVVRREQGTWSIDLDAELEATSRWLSGVRQPCQERLATALGQSVSLHLPAFGSA
ncbi:flagellar hook-length control protein FliK [Pseudomonas fluorescens]|nr:flagellar hook-length control protein FliK [Pseudomonas fluorescens]